MPDESPSVVASSAGPASGDIIPYGHQSIDDSDVEAVARVLRGDWLTQGPEVEAFEEELAGLVGARFAVCFANGTAALHGAVAAAGLGPGDRVATPSFTFVASANCARYVGATVEFIDIETETLNLNPDLVPPDCDALVAVHYAGLPVDLSRLGSRPRVIIEDAAHALGASTVDGPVGNCARSDMCAFSFHPVKAITTGEGGAVTTNSSDLAARLRRFRNHGTVLQNAVEGWRYDVVETGYNYRLTDIQAALGRSQLRRLRIFIEARNVQAARYRAELSDADLVLPPSAPQGWNHAYHLFTIRVQERLRVFDALRNAGIRVQVHYVPVHHHSVYRDVDSSRVPNTDLVYNQLISLPIYPTLTEQQQDYVVDTLRVALRARD